MAMAGSFLSRAGIASAKRRKLIGYGGGVKIKKSR
jgi:hypothetical protein